MPYQIQGNTIIDENNNTILAKVVITNGRIEIPDNDLAIPTPAAAFRTSSNTILRSTNEAYFANVTVDDGGSIEVV